jgi:hypothetical protein
VNRFYASDVTCSTAIIVVVVVVVSGLPVQLDLLFREEIFVSVYS